MANRELGASQTDFPDPYAEELYVREFSKVKGILSADVIPEGVRNLADQTAEVHARAKVAAYLVERAKSPERQIQELAKSVMDIAQQIIEGRGWSTQPSSQPVFPESPAGPRRYNFAAAFSRNVDSYMGNKLRVMCEQERTTFAGKPVTSFSIIDVDLIEEVGRNRLTAHGIYLAFIKRLGFVDSEDELKPANSRINWWLNNNCLEVTHPVKPFVAYVHLQRENNPLIDKISIRYRVQTNP